MTEDDDLKSRLSTRRTTSRAKSDQSNEPTEAEQSDRSRPTSQNDSQATPSGPTRAGNEQGAGAGPDPVGRLADDPIEDRQGNYLLSIGYSGSGKTTFQSFLTYYLTHSDEFSVDPRINPDGSAQGWDPMKLYNDWVSRWRRGEFPPATRVGEQGLREITMDVTPRGGRQIPAALTFLEVSGENLRQVVAEESLDPRLPNTLHRFFENPNINWTFCMVIDPEWGDANDRLFESFIKYLDVNHPGLRDRISLAVLISKPEDSLRTLKSIRNGYEHYQTLRGDILEDYLAEIAPRTSRLLDTWPNQSATGIMTLHVGESETRNGVPAVRKTDFRDIHNIFSWIYGQFTGVTLGPTWWQKLLAWIKE